MPRTRVESGTASMTRVVTDMHLRLAEMTHVDMRGPGPQLAVADRDDRSGADEEDDHEDADGSPDEETHGRVHRREDEGGHRRREGGGDHDPQRRPEPLAVAVGTGARCPGTARCLLHYPRWVTETVDVPIIAPDIPVYAHPGDAGADLVAAEAVRLEPGRRALVGTGVRVALPEGHVAFVVPRSGLAAKHGITVVNAPGTIDAGYRGEIKVILLNTDTEHAHDIAVGDRIAQLIVMPVPRARFIPVGELPDSVRGEGGFGSTGYQKDNKDGVLA